MSRAKLGLYIFGRVSLFRGCNELQKTFKLLLQRSTKLHLFPEEEYSPYVISKRKNPTVIDDMPGMVQYIFNFFQTKVDEWKKTRPELLKKYLQKENDQTEETIEEQDETMKVDEELDKTDNTDQVTEDDAPFEKIAPDDDGLEEKDEDIQIDD